MEHVELVIKIPEEIYNEIKEKHSISLEHFISYTAYLTLAVEYGTPLPEGHGRLIDANEVTAYNNLYEVPTIIDAAKE